MQDKLEIKDKIKPLYNPNEAWLSSLLMRVLRLVVFLLIGLFLAYIKSHEQSSKGIMTICYEIFLSLNTLFSFSKGIVATLYLIKAKYQIILIVLGVTIGLEILWYPFSNWVINQVVLQFNRIRNLIKWKKSIFDDGARCVLLDGPWGSGKTTYYKNHIKPYFNSEPIYISCFSATRDQLITQLIIANPIFNLLSLHGVLSGLIKNSWQSFMPRNKIIVFDDLERLHSDERNYVDLIAIISYLIVENRCMILLICNKIELRSIIFNSYLEKITPAEHNFNYWQNIDCAINSLRKKQKCDLHYHENLTNKLLEIAKQNNFTNIRILEIAWKQIVPKSQKQYLVINTNTNANDIIANNEIVDSFYDSIGEIISMAAKLNNLYYIDNALYNKIRNGELNSRDEYNKRLSDFNIIYDDIKDEYNKLPSNNVVEDYLERHLKINDYAYFSYLFDNTSKFDSLYNILFDEKFGKVVDKPSLDIQYNYEALKEIDFTDFDLSLPDKFDKPLSNFLKEPLLKELKFATIRLKTIQKSIFFAPEYFKSAVKDLSSSSVSLEFLTSLGVLFVRIGNKVLLDELILYLTSIVNVYYVEYRLAKKSLLWFLEEDKTCLQIREEFINCFNEYVKEFFTKLLDPKLPKKTYTKQEIYDFIGMTFLYNNELKLNISIKDIIVDFLRINPNDCFDLIEYYLDINNLLSNIPEWVLEYIYEFKKKHPDLAQRYLELTVSSQSYEIRRQYKEYLNSKVN